MKITKLEDVDPMIDDIAVKARCISLWHSHRKNEEKNPYSLDCVLQDEEVCYIEFLYLFIMINLMINVYFVKVNNFLF